MLRHFYITEDLDDLATVEQELKQKGFSPFQIHVLSEKDSEVEKHQLNEVEAVLKKDVVHSTEIGAAIGVVFAALVLTVAYLLGWTSSAAGWLPFIFLSIVILGFCTWEGGLFGIQEPNYQFKQFQDKLKKGMHVFFVDVDPEQEPVLANVVGHHPKLQMAGVGEARPRWFVRSQDTFRRFMKSMP
ncbi:NAD/FAD-utilizing enzyme [Flocculibacter collagenilyticus]|uniref:NAD/FAD-utilizing enzyme n=1 Tax=Flocculibacter collagenilyticus TaxID=2744479 RepID=UPI0018F427F6|nr:NAD/FAD-utilizing enzyme [Flocculibacter collagenilyticus]